MTQFRLRFRLEEIATLAARYPSSIKLADWEAEKSIEREISPRVREVGYYSKPDFLVLTRWKSPRAQRRCEQNPAEFIEEATRTALGARDERLRIGILRLLDGVDWPTASVLLHFGSRDPYPILDFRALWQFSKENQPRGS
ncbi:MAG: hypothetical protein M3P24_01045 [Gemmatimonadota bacterium]|nr:hypothetical protein [Gemmatimonadota bacterium]